eukprot:COSAG02_NODE_1064_length_14845_cov_137.957616_2_plen_454_part_00
MRARDTTDRQTDSPMDTALEEAVPPDIAAKRQRISDMEKQLAKARQELLTLSGASFKPFTVMKSARGDSHFLYVPADRTYGMPLGQLLAAAGDAKVALVSTPQFGPGPREGEFKVPVMDALERAAGACFPTLVAAYDFKGSASAQDCAKQQPDCDMSIEDWGDTDKIQSTQWCRYWSGRVRATLSALLLGANAIPSPVSIRSWRQNNEGGLYFDVGCRITFAFSIAGGTVTQTEHRLLGELISTTVADLSTREIDLKSVYLYWVRFECINDCLKALQGYGGIQLSPVRDANMLGKPGSWTDGPYHATFDLLKSVPGSTPDERREYLMQERLPDASVLGQRLNNAITAGSVGRVRELLAAKADPNYAMNDTSALHSAATNLADPAIVRALLEAGANPLARCQRFDSVLARGQKFWSLVERDEEGVVQSRVDEITLTLSQFAVAEQQPEPEPSDD